MWVRGPEDQAQLSCAALDDSDACLCEPLRLYAPAQGVPSCAGSPTFQARGPLSLCLKVGDPEPLNPKPVSSQNKRSCTSNLDTPKPQTRAPKPQTRKPDALNTSTESGVRFRFRVSLGLEVHSMMPRNFRALKVNVAIAWISLYPYHPPPPPRFPGFPTTICK